MLLIDVNGVAIDARISRSRSSNIERDGMKIVHGIIVHQTGGATSQSALDSYKKPSATGAHFLIDRDGQSIKLLPFINKRGTQED